MTGWGETLRTALEALGARRMRSALTMLGILIGIAAVMLIVGLGQGAQRAITQQINALGSNMIIVTPGQTSVFGGFRGASVVSSLTTADALLLADDTVAPSVAAVAPTTATRAALRSRHTTWTSQVVGTVPDWLAVRARVLAAGRFFTAEEVAAGAPVAVLGPRTAAELFPDGVAVGETIGVASNQFTVIGVLAEAGSSLTTNEDDTVVVPGTTFAARLSAATNPLAVSAIYLQAHDDDSLPAAYQEVRAALLTSHRVTAADADFSVNTQAALVDAAASVTGVLTTLLSGIAAISLLVGGIGVMNIMLVSVSERVREIGLRKALGATPALIRRQFLVEAGILGVLGGLLGIGLGLAGAAMLSPTLGITVELSLPATALALSVALGIGLVAGVYPAGRAARLAPIDALRSE